MPRHHKNVEAPAYMNHILLLLISSTYLPTYLHAYSAASRITAAARGYFVRQTVKGKSWLTPTSPCLAFCTVVSQTIMNPSIHHLHQLRRHHHHHHIPTGLKIEWRAAIKIQKLIRGFLGRRKVRTNVCRLLHLV